MKKRLISVGLVLVLVLAMSFNAYARWNSTTICNTSLSFTGSTANCGLTVKTVSPSDSISATLELKNSKGIVIKIWTNITGTGYVKFDDTYSPVSSGTYTLVATVKVTGTNGNDDITVSSSATKP